MSGTKETSLLLVLLFLAIVEGQNITTTPGPNVTTTTTTPRTTPTTTTPTTPSTTNVTFQTADALCRFHFPNALYMTAREMSCGMLCSGYQRRSARMFRRHFVTYQQPSGSRFYRYQTLFKRFPKEDGIPCGRSMECLNGGCVSSNDIRLCKRAVDHLLSMKVVGCTVQCTDNRTDVIKTVVMRPEGSICSSGRGVRGSCSSTGRCLEETWFF